MEVAPSLRSREAAGLGWGPCPFGSRLQLIWGHLQKKCLLSDHEGQGAWGLCQDVLWRMGFLLKSSGRL